MRGVVFEEYSETSRTTRKMLPLKIEEELKDLDSGSREAWYEGGDLMSGEVLVEQIKRA